MILSPSSFLFGTVLGRLMKLMLRCIKKKLTVTQGSVKLTWDTNVTKWYDGSATFSR